VRIRDRFRAPQCPWQNGHVECHVPQITYSIGRQTGVILPDGQTIARSRSLPHSLVRRARIVLMSAKGVSNQTIAERCGVSVPVTGTLEGRAEMRISGKTGWDRMAEQ